MVRTVRRWAAAGAAIALSFAAPYSARAEAVTDQILSRADYFESSACAIVKVELNFPARYVRHFPFDHGQELRIEIVPVRVDEDERKFLFRRESLRPPEDARSMITSILYEGSAVPRPTLTFVFRRDLSFKVGQGGDFRSLVVAIAKPDSSGTCEPEFPETE
jgi:hypothetical protein